MTGGTRLQLAAPAKLNLYLHIAGRRDDGYHRVDSLIAFAETGDIVTVTPARDLTLVVDGPFAAALPPSEDNLVLRAAAQLRARASVASGAAITLTKNLPVASGIGGGSADAAATLRALAVLWRLDAETCGSAAIAAGLGADVPVCLDGRTSLVTGIGDRIAASPRLPAIPVVLANPGVALPTADVFRGYDAAQSQHGGMGVADDWRGIADAATLATRLSATANDLEAAAIALAPAIADALAALGALPGCLLARMSGSGATCLALFADDAAARAAAAALQATCPRWWVVATRLRSAPPDVVELH